MINDYFILLTIDVEDWFQVENFKQCIPFPSWSSYELRVEKNTHRLLDLLDISSNQQRVTSNQQRATCNQQPATSNQIHATFFVLGWIAERLPHLVREIHSRGQEVASHGYNHKLCTECSTKELEKDLIGSKKLLEDIIGAKVYGYRSPSFSINKEVLRLIEDSGYLYDSSYNSFGLHGRYGKLDISDNEKKGIAIQFPKEVSGEAAFHKIVKRFYFYELPISNLKFNLQSPISNLQSSISNLQSPISNPQSSISNLQSLVLPWGGGGYFRLIPFALFKRGIQSILEKEKAYLFYMHPWEIDPEQPKVKKAPFFFRLRHYVNLDRSISKLNALVESFKSTSFISCKEYLASIGNK